MMMAQKEVSKKILNKSMVSFSNENNASIVYGDDLNVSLYISIKSIHICSTHKYKKNIKRKVFIVDWHNKRFNVVFLKLF